MISKSIYVHILLCRFTDVACEGLRVGSRFSEGRLGYGVDSRKSANIGWIMGHRVAARKGSGPALLASMIFDKDNPADRQYKGNGGREQEGKMIPVTPG
jgi:hypothetical protein